MPIQSEPVSPPPITITSLSVALISSPRSLIPSTRLLFWPKKSMACTTPFKLEPSIGKFLLMVAPPVNTTASKSSLSTSALISTPIWTPHEKVIPSSFNTSNRLSITFFSILKSGIP